VIAPATGCREVDRSVSRPVLAGLGVEPIGAGGRMVVVVGLKRPERASCVLVSVRLG
jgi:hypothetical protein